MEKSNKGLMIFLVIIIFLLVGYISYDKFLSENEKCVEIENFKNDNNGVKDNNVVQEQK